MRNKLFTPNERWCFPQTPPLSSTVDPDKPWCYPEGPPGEPDDDGCFPENPPRGRRRRFGLEDLAHLR